MHTQNASLGAVVESIRRVYGPSDAAQILADGGILDLNRATLFRAGVLISDARPQISDQELDALVEMLGPSLFNPA